MYKRLNITLPDNVLARADAFASAERYTRSGLISAALDDFIERRAPQRLAVGGASLAEEAQTAYAARVPEAASPSFERVSDLAGAFFRARDDVEAAWLFGSVARGDAGPLSDIDIAVLPVGRLSADERWRLRLDLAGRLPGVFGVAEVDVVVLPEVSVLLGHRALVQGRRVWGEHSRAAAEAEIRAANEYWDFEPVRRMQDQALTERLRDYGAR
jgi:predicted nucleotidyltransferase/predicted transcriptional regulator